MKLKRLQIDGYKNVCGCEIEFDGTHLINAVIGGNGSGKSNLIEAIIQILIGCYFDKPPRFEFMLELESQTTKLVLRRHAGRMSVTVNDERVPMDDFAAQLRQGPEQTLYPDLTLIYYSGECRRVRMQVAKYRRHFYKLTRDPETHRFRPLFVQSSNEQSQVILLALFAHGHVDLLQHLKLESIADVSIVLRSPDGFDPIRHEPKLWNTEGNVRRIVAALDDTSSFQDGGIDIPLVAERISTVGLPQRRPSPREERRYFFDDGRRTGIRMLADRLERDGDNLYLALENLRARGMLRSVSYSIRGAQAVDAFSFDQLSEGEKQLLAVIGAITLTNQSNNLVLLDEPDTHLNPHWSWDYPSMLKSAFHEQQQQWSTTLMATHDPVMISGMVKEQVLLAHSPTLNQQSFTRPRRNPRGQGVANLLCSHEFFGLPSSLDKETQKLLQERLAISIKSRLTTQDKARLKALNEQLEILPGISERDPEFVAFLRQRQQQIGQ